MNRGVLRYTADLATEHAHGKYDRLLRTLGYCVEGERYCAVKGMLTDYSSTPHIYDAFVKPFKVKFAGVVHDAIYKTGKDCLKRPVKRSEADMVWREVAQHGEYSASKAQAWAGWLGLRIGGWVTWHNYRRAEQYNDYY